MKLHRSLLKLVYLTALCVVLLLFLPSGNTQQEPPTLTTTDLQLLLEARFDTSFKLTTSVNSGSADYHYFQQYISGYPVHQRGYKVAVANGQVVSVKGNHLAGHWGNPPAFTDKVPVQYADWEVSAETISLQPDYGWVRSLQLYSSERQTRLQVLIDSEGAVLQETDLRCFVDSAATVLVFKPDPLTTAMVDYGADFVDGGDADNAALNGQRIAGTMDVTFETDSFFLRNDFFEITELGDPVVPIIPQQVPTFLYERSEDGFEQTMAFYHLNSFKQYLDAIGFDMLADEFLEVDVHAVFGADNSFFLPGDSSTPSSLQFGEGGVDDADDADVIIHEYAHAISYSASPGSNSGFERQGLDEGFGDYLAVSYSRGFSEHNWARVFSWDGHNPFWNGRRVDWDWHYPEDLGSSIYTAGQLWASAMFDIWAVYGKNITDRLVIEGMYNTFPNMSLSDAAQSIITADSLLFGGVHYDTLFMLLEARGLLGGVSGESGPLAQTGRLLNSAGFAAGEGPIFFVPGSTASFTFAIWDLNGRLVHQGAFYGHAGQQQAIPFEEAEKGTYLLEISNESSRGVFKIQRW